MGREESGSSAKIETPLCFPTMHLARGTLIKHSPRRVARLDVFEK